MSVTSSQAPATTSNTIVPVANGIGANAATVVSTSTPARARS